MISKLVQLNTILLFLSYIYFSKYLAYKLILGITISFKLNFWINLLMLSLVLVHQNYHYVSATGFVCFHILGNFNFC